MYQRILCFASTIPRIRLIRWEHTDVFNRGRGLGNVHEEINRRFTKRTLERLHRWDGMIENDWFMIYRDNYASRVVLLLSMAIPVVGLLTSENSINDLKDGRLWDAFKNTNIVQQMGVIVVFPVFCFLLVTYMAWHLNAFRIHRIYVSKKDQNVFVAVVSHWGMFTRKIPFTRHNVRILESAGHQLWSFVKGSVKINKYRFLLHDEGFREIQYRHQMLRRNTKLPVTDEKRNKIAL